MKKATNYMRRILACVLSAGMILNSVSLPTAEELTAGEDFILQEAELISSGAEGLQEEYARTEEGYQEDLNNQEDSPSDFISDTAGDSAFPELTSQDEGSLPAAMDGEVLAASMEGEELPAAMEGEQIVYTWSELQKALKKPAGSKMTVDDEKCYVIQLGGPITAGNADTALEVEFEKAPIVLDLNGYRISRNLKSRKDDGSVIDITRGTLILKDSRGGGEITGGFSLEGGGVNVGYYSTFRQTAGTITGNEATSGGGVVVHGGRFEMTGGEIASNKASNGGGVHVYSGGTFILNGGRITYNKANSKGGGVYLDRGNAILQDGSITGNEAFSGGAVYQCNGSLGINKATLRWNTAKNGGGLYVENGTCSLLEDSLWIVDNTADKGRNVCILGGEVRIGALDYYPGDFYLEGETSVLTLTRRLSGEHRIYVEVDSAHQPAITKGFQEYNPPYMGWNEQAYFSTKKGYVICMDGEEAAIRREHPIKTEWEWSSNLREADLKISCEHCHANFGNYIAAKVTGPAVDPETRRLVYTAEATYNGVVYTDKKEAPEQPSGYIPIAWWELNEMLKTGGNSVTDPQTGERKQMIRLYSDFIAGENDYCLEFRYTEGIPVYLDLNGHTIDRNLFKGQDYSGEESDGNVLTVANGTLVIMDSAGGGKITGGCNHWGGGIYVSRYGNLVLEGGSITGNASSSAGGGIYVNEGSLTVQGGSIQNNMARQGGGVFIKTGDASFTGGTITENRAEHAGGGIYNDEGFLKLGGTLITGNGSYFGGGLYLGEGKAALSGKVTVYDNKGITRDEIEGKTDGDIYLDGDEARLVIEGPLSAEDGRKQNIGMYYRRSGPITEGYSQYHEGTIPSELFSNSQSEGFLLCMDDERKEVVLTMDGHDFQYTWEWEGYTSASLFAVCSRCGERYLAADPSLTTITGPAYSEEEGMYVFTASVTLDGKEYKGTKPYELDLEFVEEVAPYVDEDGSYVFGTAAHFRTIVDGETVYLAQNEDGTPGARVQKEDLRLSWFVFEGEIIARYTGPVSDDPEQVVVVEIPKTYTDENGKTVKVVRLGWNEESLFEQNRFDRAPYRVICTENIRAIDEYTFKNCYLESFTGDTSSLTHIGTEAFANCGDLFTEIILTAQERIVFGPGAFSGNSDEEGNIRLTVKLYHASERFSGVEGSGKDTYLVEYLDEHDLAVVEEETVWADDFHSASFRLECRKWSLCTEKPEFKDVPAEWEERED
ncbi:MAG: hypothetical protein IIY55_04255, partial [Blautia sp.]|nr:hypothetical protein [Blautia sp.]